MEQIQKKLWETEQEILDVFHWVCKKNHLRYSLAYGTLIGAVRHKGFIPWDDDIDVVMPREDYEKLIRLWKNEAPEGYILQQPYDYPDMEISFAKIRKDHTTFFYFEGEKNRKYQKGVFIDVFPFDRAASGVIQSKWQKLCCYISMLYNRGYTSGAEGIKGIIEKALLACVPKGCYRRIEKRAEDWATKWNNNSQLKWFGFQTVADMNHHYAPDAFDNLIELEFEKKKYYAFRNYDQVLRDEYGDYMQLPPENERKWKHHPIIIDFEHNYEEIKEQNNDQNRK